MLLHWIFVLSGFIQIQKRIQIPFENRFGKLEKKKKKEKKENVFFILSFWPISPAASCFLPRLLLVGRSAFPSRWSAHGPFASSPPRLGPSRRKPSSCAQATTSPLLSASHASNHFLKPSATTPSKASTDRIHPLNLFLPYLEHLWAI
jgi:hypothetical protein